jgi:hypothetical protein
MKHGWLQGSVAAVACLLGVAGTQPASALEMAFIVGVQNRLSIDDFVVSDDGATLARTLPLYGVVDGALDFTVVANTEGVAGYDTGFRCWRFEPGADGSIGLSAGAAPDCHLTHLDPDDRLVFEVQVRVSCSGVDIIDGTIRQITPLDAATLREARQRIDPSSGELNQPPFDAKREGSLIGPAPRREPFLEGRLQDGSDCQDLSVEVTLSGGTELDILNVSILAHQKF